MTGATLPNQNNFTNAFIYMDVYFSLCLPRENMQRSSLVLENLDYCAEVAEGRPGQVLCFAGSLGGF